eukprot:271222_1
MCKLVPYVLGLYHDQLDWNKIKRRVSDFCACPPYHSDQLNATHHLRDNIIRFRTLMNLMELKYGFTHKYILQISNKTCPPNITHIINIISVINSCANYTIISLPNPPNDNQIPTIETTAQSAQLLDIGDGMDIGQRLVSVIFTMNQLQANIFNIICILSNGV